MNESRILLEKDGFVRETINREYLGDQSQILRNVATAIPASVLNIGQLNPKIPYRVHAQSKAAHTLVFTRLPEINLSTFYRYMGENKDKCYPVWQRREATDFQASFLWRPTTPDLAIWYVMMLAPPAGAGEIGTILAGAAIKFYLLVVKIGTGGLWKLPFCNIYEDGSICMGAYKDEEYGVPMLERFTKSLAHFWSSPWNTHLHEYTFTVDGAIHGYTKLLMFNPESGATLKTPTDWERYCKKVSNTNYSDLPLHLLSKANL